MNAGGVYITCTSPSPFGPFSDFQQSNVTLATDGGGDFHLAADASDSGTGYILFGANGMWLSRLTPDYRNAALPASATVDFNQTFVEAPVSARGCMQGRGACACGTCLLLLLLLLLPGALFPQWPLVCPLRP